MRILITGATGFIGRNLLKGLFDAGYRDITCTVRKTSDTSYLTETGVKTVECDITEAGSVDKAFSGVRPEVVYHCAAMVISRDKDELDRVNITGTANICGTCSAHDVGRLIHLSSVAVISGNPQVPLTDDLPLVTTCPYGSSKASAETIVEGYREAGGKAVIIRPCIVYGEGEPHGSERILRLVKTRRIPVFDIPEMNTRLHLVYIGNVVQALLSSIEGDGALEGAFIVADPEPIALRGLVDILYMQILENGPPVLSGFLYRLIRIYPPARRGFDRLFKERLYDISRAREVLGYDPVTGTEDALKRTAGYWCSGRTGDDGKEGR